MRVPALIALGLGLPAWILAWWLQVLPWPLEVAVRAGARMSQVPASAQNVQEAATTILTPQPGADALRVPLPPAAVLTMTLTVVEPSDATPPLTGWALGDTRLVDRYGTLGVSAGTTLRLTMIDPPPLLWLTPVGGRLVGSSGKITLTTTILTKGVL